MLQLMAACAHSLARAQELMDQCGLILLPEEAAVTCMRYPRMFLFFFGKLFSFEFLFPTKSSTQEISRMLHLHLRSTEFLASYCWRHQIMAFKMRPKHHYLWHVAVDTALNQLNPRLHHVWSDEKFLGLVKRIACRCHGATVQKRAIERYLVSLSTYLAKMA